jgi:hypothetical protein
VLRFRCSVVVPFVSRMYAFGVVLADTAAN